MDRSERLSFNPKTVGSFLSILVVFVGLLMWVASVYATGEQNTKDISHQESEINLLTSQLSEMKIQLTIITEQNKQLKQTLEEVRKDVAEIKNGR